MAQLVINLDRELEYLEFEKDEEWEGHVQKFHELIGKLSSYDKPVPTLKKYSQMIRTLPQRFEPIAMVSESDEFFMEIIVASVKAEIYRLQNQSSQERNLLHLLRQN